MIVNKIYCDDYGNGQRLHVVQVGSYCVGKGYY